MIDVLEAGFAPHTVPYREGWELQRRIHADVVADDRNETLILLEHDAVFTAGSRTEDGERPAHPTLPSSMSTAAARSPGTVQAS